MARATAAIALLVALVMVWQGLNMFQGDLAFSAAETEVSFWGRGEYQPTERTREATGYAVENLVAAAPAQPAYLSLAASYYAWRAYWTEEIAVENDYNAQALAAQYAAQQSRPAYLQGWEAVEGYAVRAQQAAELQTLAQQRLDALQPKTEP